VDYTGFTTVNVQRFGQKFVGKVANPQEVLLFSKPAARAAKPDAGQQLQCCNTIAYFGSNRYFIKNLYIELYCCDLVQESLGAESSATVDAALFICSTARSSSLASFGQLCHIQ